MHHTGPQALPAPPPRGVMPQSHSNNADLPGLCWLMLTPHWAASRLWDMDEEFTVCSSTKSATESLKMCVVVFWLRPFLPSDRHLAGQENLAAMTIAMNFVE